MKQETGNREQETGSTLPESSLVPNSTLLRMYAGMLESRLLEEKLRKRDGKAARPHVRGQEACRVSALLDLGTEDFSSDLYGSVTAAFVRGEPLERLAKHRPGANSALAGLLPELPETRDRLQQAMGVAVALKRLKLKQVVVLFARTDEVKSTAWLPHLHQAARLELPMLFVLLPNVTGKTGFKVEPASAPGFSARATAAGVSGIPVDASDAIALYRVAQESLGRARAGGGPALMECIPFVLEGKKSRKKAALPDAVTVLAGTLLRRKICDQSWMDGIAAAVQDRLKVL